MDSTSLDAYPRTVRIETRWECAAAVNGEYTNPSFGISEPNFSAVSMLVNVTLYIAEPEQKAKGEGLELPPLDLHFAEVSVVCFAKAKAMSAEKTNNAEKNFMRLNVTTAVVKQPMIR